MTIEASAASSGTGRPWGSVDPNSAHQRWSRWQFIVEAHRSRAGARAEVIDNFRRYIRALFKTTMGRVHVTEAIGPDAVRYELLAEVEGPDVHDATYRAWVQREFAGVFVAKGFGPRGRLVSMEAILLAGSAEDGRPAQQLIVMPTLAVDLMTGQHRRRIRLPKE